MSAPENTESVENSKSPTIDTKQKRAQTLTSVLFGISSLFYLLGFFSLVLWKDESHLYFIPIAIAFSIFATIRLYQGEEHEEKRL